MESYSTGRKSLRSAEVFLLQLLCAKEIIGSGLQQSFLIMFL